MSSTIQYSTQDHVDIEDVVNNLIIQKDGTCSMVLQTNAINFGLLSEEEQDASIYAYAAFLNSLTFSIQVLIRSDVKDISGYLKQLEEKEGKQQNISKKNQIKYYRQFIASLITDRNVLEKKFYIVIPFSALELGTSKSLLKSFGGSKKLNYDINYIVEKALTTLEPRKDHVMRQLGRIGLTARQLSTQELIQLLFSMYNPSSSQGQRISSSGDYTTPLVQPAYIKSQEVTMSDQSNPLSTPPAVGTPMTPSTPTQTPSNPTPPAPQPPQPIPTPTSPTPTTPPTQPTPAPTMTPPKPVEVTNPLTPTPSTPPQPDLSTNSPKPLETPTTNPSSNPLPTTAPSVTTPTLTPPQPTPTPVVQASDNLSTTEPQQAINAAIGSLNTDTPTGEETKDQNPY